MNLADISTEEQTLRGKIKSHTAAKLVAEKEAANHATAIDAALARLDELEVAALNAFKATRDLAAPKTSTAIAEEAEAGGVSDSAPAEPPAEASPITVGTDSYTVELPHINASNAA